MAAGSSRSLSEIIATVPPGLQRKLDKEVDFEHKNVSGLPVPKHLGRIADLMTEWEGSVADYLGLTDPEKYDIREKYPNKPSLQRRDALNKWKCRLGYKATYRALIKVFYDAEKPEYADIVCTVLSNSNNDETSSPSPPPAAVTTPENSLTSDPPSVHIDFSPDLNPEGLSKWLRQEYGEDYGDDVQKIIKAKISGKHLLKNVAKIADHLDFSLGFRMEIEDRVEKLAAVEPSAGPTPATNTTSARLPQGGAASCPSNGSTNSTGLAQDYEVKNYHLSLLRWRYSTDSSEKNEVRVYQTAACRWRLVAERLGLELGVIESIDKNHRDDDGRLRAVFGRWFENASNLPNSRLYPKSWPGLIRLLTDSDLGELATKIDKALSAPFSNVKGNM